MNRYTDTTRFWLHFPSSTKKMGNLFSSTSFTSTIVNRLFPSVQVYLRPMLNFAVGRPTALNIFTTLRRGFQTLALFICSRGHMGVGETNLKRYNRVMDFHPNFSSSNVSGLDWHGYTPRLRVIRIPGVRRIDFFYPRYRYADLAERDDGRVWMEEDLYSEVLIMPYEQLDL